MLKKLTIARFKSIRDQSLEFGLVNIFIGGNGAGKSNFLEAIGLASAACGRGISETDLARKGIRQSPPALIKSAHKGMDIPKTIELLAEFDNDVQYKCNLTASDNDFNLKFHSESCSFGGVPQFGRSGNGDRVFGNQLPRAAEKFRGLWDQIKASFAFSPDMIEQLDEFSRYCIFAPQTDFLRGVKVSSMYDPPVGLHGEGLSQAVMDILFQLHGHAVQDSEQVSYSKEKLMEFSKSIINLVFLPGWTNAFKVGSIDTKLVSKGIADAQKEVLYFVDRFMHEKRRTLTAYDSSEGTLFLLFITVLLCHISSPKYFSVDNIDNALNPKLTRKLLEETIRVVKTVRNDELSFGPKQVFLTSHNPTSIDAFDIFDDDVRVFVAYRDKKGQTLARRLAPPANVDREKWAILKGGKTLSQLWIEGLIPNLNGGDL